MKNLFVSPEISEQLKKKGFKEPCLEEDDASDGCLYYLDKDGYPMYNQVVDWFRDKHKIQIKVMALDIKGKVKWHCECQDLTLVKTFNCKHKVFKFKVATPNISNTYYGALNKGIKEAIKLITKK